MEIQKKVPLKPFTTFKIGGEARFFCRVKNTDELLEALIFARKEKVPFLILGSGSNILLSDDGFPGLVIKMEITGIKYQKKEKSVEVSVGAGENWDAFVAETVEKNLHGLENLSGIPGTVGAAPVQNIGAYGVEVKDFISWVEVFDTKELKTRHLSKEQCEFEYRSSIFKTPKGKHFAITRVGFLLHTKPNLKLHYRDVAEHFNRKNIAKPSIYEVREAILFIRSGKFPDLNVVGTAGSFFKNPILSKKRFDALIKMYPDMPFFPESYGRVKVPLGWILEHVVGVKGKREGDVASFEKQALVLVNFGNARSHEVYNFARNIEREVKEKTGIDVEWEVQWVE